MNSADPIVWSGDLDDDCTAFWNGLILRAEWMDEMFWWWAVSIHDGRIDQIDSSNNYSTSCIGGENARKFAELAARKYLTKHNSLITDETSPSDLFTDPSFANRAEFTRDIESILLQQQSTEKKTLIIDGKNFETLEEFFTEADKVLTRDLTWKTGHNLDAFNDLLRGGFGIHDFEEPIKLVWVNSLKSKFELSKRIRNETLYEILVSIIKDHEHIEFVEQ